MPQPQSDPGASYPPQRRTLQSTAAPPAHAVSQVHRNAVRLLSRDPEFLQLAAYLDEMRCSDLSHLDAWPIWLINQPDQLAHLLDGEAEVPAPSDERQAPPRRLAVASLSASFRASTGSRPISS